MAGNYYARHDYEGVEQAGADALMASLRDRLATLPGTAIGDLTVSEGRRLRLSRQHRRIGQPQTGHPHPVRRRIAHRVPPVGHRHPGRDAARLSRTLRTGRGHLAQETGDALAPLVAAAETIASIKQHTGRSEPDVIT
ncbi:hypothetical protein SASPL_157685 [Salvia splendens]|uniref:Uncharacterized protein n=1 Tax=Salvia splendens TaxID=180675 RepID=A0A8X8YV37_SALSN|nr:hypothetical protein SASPL_157685 [Salvia splendens]